MGICIDVPLWILVAVESRLRNARLLHLHIWTILSLTGLAAAMSGLTDAEKAKKAAGRIFELIDRKSDIDPLSDEGKKQN